MLDQELHDTEKAKESMLCLKSASFEGLDAKSVEVEATFTKGLPGFSIVGLAGGDIQEAKERVKSALLMCGFAFPPLRITINLSPSDMKKQGSHFDLAIALLVAMQGEGSIDRKMMVFGELGLDGRVKGTSQLFALLLSLKEQGIVKKAIVPKEAMGELSFIPGITLYPVEHLRDALVLLKEGVPQKSLETQNHFEKGVHSLKARGRHYYYRTRYSLDFYDVKGQTVAKRAALIAAAGMHNLMMEGSPGCGKSMIAKRIAEILPPLSEDEILAIAKHHSLNGDRPSFEPKRPFRSPHHSATAPSIFGGGSGQQMRIGEVALAHKGVLFFDEMPHFSKQVIEALREPLQERMVHIARVQNKVSYQAEFLFVAALNPCPCGNLLSNQKECRCNEAQIARYKSKLSDPILDRIDLFVTMQPVSTQDKHDVSSEQLHKEVIKAFVRQKERGQINFNGWLSEEEIEHYCVLDDAASAILNKAIERFGLTHRSIASIKKVARTIADLNAKESIGKEEVLESLSFRRR